ncbi:MAG: hydroxyacid dehydrogenase [Eubacteriales bacterium]
MKKAIFLSENKEKFYTVYTDDIIQRLKSLTDIDDIRYSKEDVLNEPNRFSDTAFIFSTWGMPGFTEDEIRAYFPRLECVFYSAGSVQGFARQFLACGVRVFSAWAANAVPVAEYTLAQILLANKGFFTHIRLMNQKRISEAYDLKKVYPGNYNEKVGLIGCGMIGSMVAEMLKKHSLEVLVYDPFLSDEKAEKLNVTRCSLQELFCSCRVISNHLPDNSATKSMLDYTFFSTMMPYSTFLNTGRGAQVVEADLARLLAERPDLTAVLDVTRPEPADPSNPFFTLPNCYLTPHIAGSLGNETVRMAEYMTDECIRYLNGDPCRYEVNAEMLATMA